MDFSAVILSGVFSASWICRLCFSSRLGNLQPLCFQRHFPPPVLLSWDVTDMCQLICCCPTGSWHCSFYSFSLFSLVFKLGIFYCSVFRFIDSFFCHIPSAIEPEFYTLSFFFWLWYFSVIWFPFGSFLYLVPVCWDFCFFPSREFEVYWSVFMVTALRPIR